MLVHDVQPPLIQTGGEAYQLMKALRGTKTGRTSTDNEDINVTRLYSLAVQVRNDQITVGIEVNYGQSVVMETHMSAILFISYEMEGNL